VYKLKEMGKISEKDIMLICKQFERLDNSKCGKITLSALIDSHHLDTSRSSLSSNSSARHNLC
jgi:potassium channel subfamily K, other eukaryote